MKRIWIVLGVALIALLAACGDDDANNDDDLYDIATLEVDFILPESAEVGETVVLEAIVTSSGEYVDDAEEVLFEYWIEGADEAAAAEEEDNSDAFFTLNPGSTAVEGEYKGDGSYQAEVIFEEEAVYEIYAHTTARGLHTMPLKSITVE